jgi:hypothetical protein
MAPMKDLRYLSAAKNAIYKAEYQQYRQAKMQREVDAFLEKAEKAKQSKADEPCSSTKK